MVWMREHTFACALRKGKHKFALPCRRVPCATQTCRVNLTGAPRTTLRASTARRARPITASTPEACRRGWTPSCASGWLVPFPRLVVQRGQSWRQRGATTRPDGRGRAPVRRDERHSVLRCAAAPAQKGTRTRWSASARSARVDGSGRRHDSTTRRAQPTPTHVALVEQRARNRSKRNR